jgi:hypothetical protein
MFRQGEGIRRRLAGTCLLGLALVTLHGCSGGKATVSGKVTLSDGTPVPAGNVTFWAGDGRTAQAPLRADGTYLMGDAPVGDVKVTVETPPPRPGPLSMGPQPPQAAKGMPQDMLPPGEKGAPGNAKSVRVPDRYRESASTPLTYTVSRGTQHKDFTITP